MPIFVRWSPHCHFHTPNISLEQLSFWSILLHLSITGSVWHHTTSSINVSLVWLQFVTLFIIHVIVNKWVVPREKVPSVLSRCHTLPCAPVLLLVWQWLRTLGTFLHNTAQMLIVLSWHLQFIKNTNFGCFEQKGP